MEEDDLSAAPVSAWYADQYSTARGILEKHIHIDHVPLQFSAFVALVLVSSGTLTDVPWAAHGHPGTKGSGISDRERNEHCMRTSQASQASVCLLSVVSFFLCAAIVINLALLATFPGTVHVNPSIQQSRS